MKEKTVTESIIQKYSKTIVNTREQAKLKKVENLQNQLRAQQQSLETNERQKEIADRINTILVSKETKKKI